MNVFEYDDEDTDNYQPPECDDGTVYAAGAYPDQHRTVLKEQATRDN